MPRVKTELEAKPLPSRDWQRRQTAILVLLWLLILTPPLACWLALFRAVEPSQATAAAATGDPLVDAYLQLALPRLFAGKARPGFVSSSWARLDLEEAEAEALRRSFGQDPRLQELLSTLDPRADFPEAQIFAAERRGTSVWLLRKRLLEARSGWRTEAHTALGIEWPGFKHSIEVRMEFYRRLEAELRIQHGAEQDLVLRDLKVLAPDSPVAWLLEAQFSAIAGDFGAAFEALRTANNKPDNTALPHCPLDIFYRLCAEGREPQDKSAGLLLTRSELAGAYFVMQETQDAFEFMLEDATRRGNLEDLALLHRSLCRLGRTVGGDPYTTACAAAKLQHLASVSLPHAAVSRGLAQSNPPALIQLKQDSFALNSAVGQAQQSSKAQALTMRLHSPAASAPGLRGILAGQSQLLGFRYQYAAAEYDDAVAWRKLIQPGGSIYRQFEALEAFDFAALAADLQAANRAALDRGNP